MTRTGNRQAFETTEFDRWAGKEGLLPEERHLVELYLDKRLDTLEGGCGGGRMLAELASRGFGNLTGFDYVDDLVMRAKDRLVGVSVDVVVADAADLPFDAGSFDQVLYLQQLLSFLRDDTRAAALREAHRVIRPGGTMLVSVLNIAERRSSTPLRLWMAWLRIVRWRKMDPSAGRWLPWLKVGGRLRLGALFDRPPYARWFAADELVDELIQTGFTLVAVTTGSQLRAGRLYESPTDLPEADRRDVLFAVCRKPQ